MTDRDQYDEFEGESNFTGTMGTAMSPTAGGTAMSPTAGDADRADPTGTAISPTAGGTAMSPTAGDADQADPTGATASPTGLTRAASDPTGSATLSPSETAGFTDPAGTAATLSPSGTAGFTDPAGIATLSPSGAAPSPTGGAASQAHNRDTLDDFREAMGAQDEVCGEEEPTSPDPRDILKSTGMSRSTPALGSYADLKAKTHFPGSTDKGVLKRTTYMTAVSNFRTGPKYTLAQRGKSAFIRSSANPAPGTYNVPNEDKTKYLKPPSFSFGGVARFGMGGEPPSKKMPGPGAYTPQDPALACNTKVGFGTSVRGGGGLVAQANPGPGAYEMRTSIGQGQLPTAAGRHPTSYMRARSLPGPGAYNPSIHYAYPTATRCGFGTSTRDDIATRSRNLVMPGPGTYEMQNFQSVGSEAPKFSATSRRRVHDLNSYVTPGPGTYNAHCTSFGY